MHEVRRASAADASELVRLRKVMLTAFSGDEPADGEWQRIASDTLQRRLSESDATLVAFVVERPDQPGVLAACAIGVVEHRLGGPDNPTGEVGYIFNVATDSDQRRQGYSRCCTTALLNWYRQRGIRKVDLRASSEGEPLYESLGFAHTSEPAMRIRLPSAEA